MPFVLLYSRQPDDRTDAGQYTCSTDYLVICGRASVHSMYAARATLESPLDSSKYIIAHSSAVRNAPSCRGSSYRHLLPINPGSERERRITSGLLVIHEESRLASERVYGFSTSPEMNQYGTLVQIRLLERNQHKNEYGIRATWQVSPSSDSQSYRGSGGYDP
jgi:hypothetical protein